MDNIVKIFDTTLRDGEQAPGFSMTEDQKIRMARQLERLGVDIVEAGFPIASTGDFEAVKKISQELKKCEVAGLARTRTEDIDRAWEALQYAKYPRIHTFIATSDIHLEHKLKMSRDDVLKTAEKMVRYAKSITANIEFSAEDAIRSDRDYLCDVFQAVIEAGAISINIPDTVGYSFPTEISEIVSYIVDKVPNISDAVVSVHCHNDLGLAAANSLAGVLVGARQVECTINGIGERAGNASLEEVVMALHTRRDRLNLHTNINTKEIYRSSQLLSNLTGMHVQRNKAIVGANAFAHEAGIHQDGMIKDKRTYEIMTPESVGIQQSALVLGKHSGRHALAKRYTELGYDLSKEELNKAYSEFTQLADKKKDIYDADLIAILQDKVEEIPEAYEMISMQVISGSKLSPTATVRLKKGEDIIEDSAVGDGPVDAACKAIDRLTEMPARLVHYTINAVSIGKDAMGEVLVQVACGEREFSGRAASTDIIEASARAYLNAINRIFYAQERSDVKNHEDHSHVL